MHSTSHSKMFQFALGLGIAFFVSPFALFARASNEDSSNTSVAVGSQYDTTHVYVKPENFDAFVSSVTAVFGGHAGSRGTYNVLPVPSSTQTQYVWTPVGNLSTFAFLTPIPYPFGQERTGYLVSDMDRALREAKESGAEVIVDKFKDPIGQDAVIQWPGGVKMQLYWHNTAPHYDALVKVPENRVYLSSDTADIFVRDFVRFSHGKVVSDDAHADAGEIGRPGQTYRRIRVESGFGKLQVNVTDGHLPYPFGYEISGYEVNDINATLAKVASSGGKVLSPRYDSKDRSSAVVEFPGGYVAEIHAPLAH
jgi:predicted enzyme related to lactoylglutathione lyase